jgi:hypothetical protein
MRRTTSSAVNIGAIFAATLTRRFARNAIVGLNLSRSRACNFLRVIPEIDVWRAASLMLKRYDERAPDESSARADELAADGDHDGAAGLEANYYRRRPAGQQGPGGTRALIGTDP